MIDADKSGTISVPELMESFEKEMQKDIEVQK